MEGSDVLGIDGSNLRLGGGVTHIEQLLKAADPTAQGFDAVHVWGGPVLQDRLPSRPWLHFHLSPWCGRSLPWRLAWQQVALPGELLRKRCQILFSPGGTLPLRCPVPAVVMSQNMLPFESREGRRYPAVSKQRLRLLMLGWSQRRSMARAKGLIFLSRHAQKTVLAQLSRQPLHARISHGVEARFFGDGDGKQSVERGRFRFLYVSMIDYYKHQDKVVEAARRLIGEGFDFELELVGPARAKLLRALRQQIEGLGAASQRVRYVGPRPFEELHRTYLAADAFVFASTCENQPISLLEAMAAGLPIACSDKEPMPEVLGEEGVYFDAERPESIAGAMRRILEDRELRERIGKGARKRAAGYSWEKCAERTFEFIRACLR